MPPRKKESEEERENKFTQWKEGNEFGAIKKFGATRATNAEASKVQVETDDISTDWTDVLKDLYGLVEALKVPKKSKEYEQRIVRTMFFPAIATEVLDIFYHGIKYTVSAGANSNHRKCRDILIRDIFDKTTADEIGGWTADDFLQKKKELVGKLKEWDKIYVAHAKTINPELASIQSSAMEPLCKLMKSNNDFHNLNLILAKQKQQETVLTPEEKAPDFRYEALEKEFVKDFTEICRIVTLYPNKEGKKLEISYDIKQMLDTLKVENWKNIPSFKFYFYPLELKLQELIKELVRMHKGGNLQVKYHIPLNEKMHTLICETMELDMQVQWLAATPLKQDQFKFLYGIQDIVYMSALKKSLLKEERDALIFDKVIPELTVFKAMLLIRDIDDRKAADIAHEEAKKQRRLMYEDEQQPEEETKDEPLKVAQNTMTSTMKSGKKKKMVEIDPEEEERKKKELAYQQELKTYGRTWIWEGYYEDSKKSIWLDGADKLRSVNHQCIEDIEDSILLKGFRNKTDIDILIQQTLDEQRQIEWELSPEYDQQMQAKEVMKGDKGAMLQNEQDKVKNPIEIGKEHDKKRKFLEQFRPCGQGNPKGMQYWNFVEEENKTPHVLRSKADPTKCYKGDNRVQQILDIIQELASQIKKYNKDHWDRLNVETHKIFIQTDADLQAKRQQKKDQQQQ